MKAHASYDLESLGWQADFEPQRAALKRAPGPALTIGRVVVEHRGSYRVAGDFGSAWAQATGTLRHRAKDRRDLPAVGDFVGLNEAGRIDTVLPRRTWLVRKGAGQKQEPQVLAANLDWVFIVTSANQEFNPRRLERYVAAVEDGGAKPLIVLNKIDLCEEPSEWLGQLPEPLQRIERALVSATRGVGREELLCRLEPRSTVALVGSSGVGKSSIANWLLGDEAAKTGGIREHDAQGRHTTSRRQLLLLPGGGALIDTPGIRQLGMWMETPAALASSFADVTELTRRCRFPDCQHEGQPGCAVGRALEDGALDPARFAAFRKLSAELPPVGRATAAALGRAARSAPGSSPRSRRRRP